MNKTKIGLIFALSLSAHAAMAADIPPAGAPMYRAPAVIPLAAYNWTGFYVGGNGGYGWVNGTASITIGGLAINSTGNLNGFLAGGQAGFNWQLGGLVLGLEGDYQWSDQKSVTTSSCGAGCSLSETTKIGSFGTARLRIGGAFDRILIYATGGAAWTSASDTLTATVGGVSADILSLSGNQWGWTVGGGLEFGIWDNWSAKVEYLYIQTTNLTGSAVVPFLGGATITETASFKDSIVRLGINYRFGGGPVVARY